MLRELSITDFGIIDYVQLSFEDGLTVITGETGAGKSMIIDAVGLLVGGRGSADFVRHGKRKAEIEGLFFVDEHHPCLQKMADVGLHESDGMVVVRREISSNGKSVCRVNGKLMTLANLRDIGRTLIDIHGQHEHQDLLQQDHHLRLLDDFGGRSLREAKQAYQQQFATYQQMKKQLRELSQNEKETNQRIDLLRFQLDEIDNAGLEPGEDEQLLNEKNKLANYEKVFHALQTGYEALNGEQKGLSWVGQAMNELEQIVDIDRGYEEMYETVSNSYYMLEEVTFSLRDTFEHLEYHPDRLNAIEERLHDIQMLKRKYGDSVSDILDYRERIAAELETITNREEQIAELEQQLTAIETDLFKKAEHLSEERRKTATSLTAKVTRELKELHMEKSTFEIRFVEDDKETTFHRDGIDDVAFYISTNPGEPLKPLAKIASGGELSRIMLALKSIFTKGEGITSIIFDEVDTGVSGRAAQSMAEKIQKLSRNSQVFCITHLAQVAAMADTHLYIVKKEQNNRTTTSVLPLSEEEQVHEIGRMISGAELTDLTKQHAKELLELASHVKTKA